MKDRNYHVRSNLICGLGLHHKFSFLTESKMKVLAIKRWEKSNWSEIRRDVF